MNGLTMYKNANDKLQFAVNGFTLPVCQYLGLKICGWWLAAAIFVFVHPLTVNPLLSPLGDLFSSSTFEGGGGLKREGGLI